MAEEKKPVAKKLIKNNTVKTKAEKKEAVKPVDTENTVKVQKSIPLLKKAWKKLDDWNFGLSGKVILILVVIGIIARFIEKL